MSAAADAIRDFITPLLPGWRIQFGRWMDGMKTDRYAVIKPVGGLPSSLVREPHFSLLLIGGLNDDASVPSDASEVVITAMNASSGALVYLQPAEPVFWSTDDGRPVFETAISAITN